MPGLRIFQNMPLIVRNPETGYDALVLQPKHTPMHSMKNTAAHALTRSVLPARERALGRPAPAAPHASLTGIRLPGSPEQQQDAWLELRRVLEAAFCADETCATSPIPLICFEGLPGAGKSTQITRIQAACEERYGKGALIDPPSDSPIGLFLKSLYAEPQNWQRIRMANPWLNPIMLAADLRMAVRAAMADGARYALVDRGIISTIFYNLDAYSQDENAAWAAMTPHLSAFYRPTVTLFLDLPVEEAHRRVVARRRGVLRAMDQLDQMRADRALLLRCQARLAHVPFCRIDAARPVPEVTGMIMNRISDFMVQ